MRLVFDIETNEVDFTHGHFLDQTHTVHCIVAYDIDQKRTFRYGPESIKDGVRLIDSADELIGHNIIQFDAPVLRKLFDCLRNVRLTDTLVWSRTLYPDRNGGHSLRAWGERLGDYKAVAPGFETYSRAMLDYCEQDVKVTSALYHRLGNESSEELWQRPLRLEHRIAEIIAEQERHGFAFDIKKAEKQLKEWEDDLDNYDNALREHHSRSTVHLATIDTPFKINGEARVRTRTVCENNGIESSIVGGPFSVFDYQWPNLNSDQEKKKILLDAGWKPKKYTEHGSPVLDESIRETEVGELLYQRNRLKRVHGQLLGLLEIQSNGRIHGGANPCGTNTGRMRHQKIVNIPRVTTNFGKEMRSLFTVPDGRSLLGYDAAALELRILAHYIGNKEYNDRVTTTDKRNDAHVLAARAANTDDRDLGKTINYALIYGASDFRLGRIVGGGKREGASIRRKLYDSIPGFERLLTNVDQAARRGYLLGLDGRKLYVRPGKSPLNTLIQGGGAVFMKTVAEILDRRAHDLDGFKVVDMHDEAQWEVDPAAAHQLTQLVHDSFTAACGDLGLTCPQEAEVKIGKTWAETH